MFLYGYTISHYAGMRRCTGFETGKIGRRGRYGSHMTVAAR